MPKKVLISLIFLLLAFVMPAAKINKAFEALKIYDYFKARKLFYASLKKEPALAAYGLAIIYYRTDNPFHSYDSAYKYIQIPYTLLKETPAEKEKFKTHELADLPLYRLRDSIHLKAFDYYLHKEKKLSVATLEQFMQNQPFSEYYLDAHYKRDSIEYQQARQQMSSGQMAAFIRSFPESYFIPQAYRDQDYYRFREFTAAGALPQIEKFIDSFPSSAYRVQAEDKLFELAAAQKNTSRMYGYIRRFPKNSHVESTWKSLYSVEVGSYSSHALNAFLQKYPDFPYRQTIEKELSLANTQLLQVMVDDRYGFIDTAGTIVIPAVYEGLEEFSDGLALAGKNDKFGYINKAGETVVPFEYDDGEAFKNGRAIVKSGSVFFLIDRSGNRITSGYDQISDFSEGLAVVKQNGLYGAIDRNGQLEIPLQYSRMGDFSEGLAYAQKNNASGYVDLKGYPVIPFLYEWAESFKYSLARVRYNSKFGLINNKGEFVLQPVYDRIEEQEQGVYVVYKNNLYGFADSTGCLLTEVIYTNPSNEKPGALTDGKWLRLITEDEQSLVNKNGKRLAEKEEYEEMYLPEYGLIRVSLNDKYGFINEKNKLVIKNVYEEAEDFTDSVALVTKKNESQLLVLLPNGTFSTTHGPNNRLSKSWFLIQPNPEAPVLNVCDKNGGIAFTGTIKDPEIILDRYLVNTIRQTTVVYDLKLKKYIFQKEGE